MTYNVFGGTLSLTQSINQSLSLTKQLSITISINIIRNSQMSYVTGLLITQYT